MDRTVQVILLIVIAAISLVNGSCLLQNLERHPCEGQLLCINDFGSAVNFVRDWPCRRRESYDYNYGYRRARTDDDYTLYVTAEQVDGTNDFDAFNVINELRTHILTLSITNGKMNSVPAAIYNALKVKSLDLSSNTIESLKLDAFSKMTSLKSLNVSCNQIADLEVSERLPAAGFSGVNTIDLSYNAISSVPNNYFRQFPELLYLDLSHNYIKSFDILTFEGITQLQTLRISDNELTKLEVAFARFEFMKELVLDHNYLTSIEESNFNKMYKLEKLNISSNILTAIEDKAFDHLAELRELDISNNTIDSMRKVVFQNNNKLVSLDISSNRISIVEPGTFEGKRVENFNIHNNPITGSLLKNTFQGIVSEKIDLSGANVTELGSELFDGEFQSLNFSRNSISKIHKTTFNKLEQLIELDLSYNQLQIMEFETTNLNNLSYFFINNNKIKKITKDMFKSLLSLKVLDLSNNGIEDIETLSFENLKELESLNLNDNPLMDIIPSQMFSGLALTTELDFTNSKTDTIQNNAFNGMISLKKFNSSHSNLTELEFNTFNGTASLEVLDLSYNQIKSFSLNNTNIDLVNELHLHYNKIQHVTGITFLGLINLTYLDLKGNNLLNIENEAFRSLASLLKVDLSLNENLAFNSSAIFSNLPTLSTVLLHHVTTRFSFANVINSSISNLDLSFCDISDINKIQVYQITKLERLNVASNKIRAIDKISFHKLSQLNFIDLSNNRLSIMEPGTFLYNKDLSVLDLSNNFLSSLKYGVFDGLVNLNTIDLSSNTLQSFSANLFHNTPHVRVVYIDNNLISDLNFGEFDEANIEDLYVGGNPIPCSSLTNFKKRTDLYNVTVRARKGTYSMENVNGISCESETKYDKLSQSNDNETAAILTRTLEEFRTTLERFLDRNESKVEFESTGLKNVSDSIENFLEVFKKSEVKNNDLLDKLMNINNSTNRALEQIEEYIKIRNVIAVDPHTSQTQSTVYYDDIEKNIVAMLSKEKQSMKNEMKNMFDDWKSHNSHTVGNNKFEAQSVKDGGSNDLKSALYFIATCLAVLICLIGLTLIFAFFKLRNRPYSNHISHSRQPLSVMEME